MTLKGRKLTESQRAEIARVVTTNLPMRGATASREQVDAAQLMGFPGRWRGYGKEGRSRGTQR